MPDLKREVSCPSCHLLQRPTAELGGVETPEEEGQGEGVAGEI